MSQKRIAMSKHTVTPDRFDENDLICCGVDLDYTDELKGKTREEWIAHLSKKQDYRGPDMAVIDCGLRAIEKARRSGGDWYTAMRDAIQSKQKEMLVAAGLPAEETYAEWHARIFGGNRSYDIDEPPAHPKRVKHKRVPPSRAAPPSTQTTSTSSAAREPTPPMPIVRSAAYQQFRIDQDDIEDDSMTQGTTSFLAPPHQEVAPPKHSSSLPWQGPEKRNVVLPFLVAQPTQGEVLARGREKMRISKQEWRSIPENREKENARRRERRRAARENK